MTFSVGERLRQARLDQGLDLNAVVARTKISVKNLEAIEADDRASIASGFFYRSFVDQYARALSLEPTELLAEVDRMRAVEAPLPLPGQNGQVIRRVEPLYRAKKSYGRMLASLALLVLTLTGCSGFYWLWRTGRMPSIAATINWMQREKSPAQIVANRIAPPPKTAESGTAKLAAVAPEPTPAPQPNEAPLLSRDYKLLLDLLAREETWLSVSSDGKQVFSGVLGPNQTKTVAGKEFAKIRVGNAGGLEVKLNGKLIGPLGGRGQVLVVVFTPDNFQIVPPARESD